MCGWVTDMKKVDREWDLSKKKSGVLGIVISPLQGVRVDVVREVVWLKIEMLITIFQWEDK